MAAVTKCTFIILHVVQYCSMNAVSRRLSHNNIISTQTLNDATKKEDQNKIW